MTGYIAPTVVDTTIKDGADKLTIEAIATLYNYKLLAAVRETSPTPSTPTPTTTPPTPSPSASPPTETTTPASSSPTAEKE